MLDRQIYYYQELGYTVWQKRAVRHDHFCQCDTWLNNLSNSTLLCLLDVKPEKAEQDLWLFITMAFDLSQQYFVFAGDQDEHSICHPCLEKWLKNSKHRHAIFFSNQPEIAGMEARCLALPALASLLDQPERKKTCFTRLQTFLCQHHLSV